MSGNVEQFERLLDGNVRTRIPDPDEAFGFDWSILITALLPILVDFLGNCFRRDTDEEIVNRIKRGGFWPRYFATKAARELEKQNDLKFGAKVRRDLAQSVLDTCDECSDDDLVALVREVKENAVEYSDIW